MPMRSKQSYLYQTISKEITEQHFPGSRLPSESVWCRELGVARETLRHTLKRLTDEKKIRRDNTGTYVYSPSAARRDSYDEPISVLMPSPDYLRACDNSSLFANQYILRGAMLAAVRMGRRIVTIPVSDSNDPDRISESQLSHLTKESMVIVNGQPWYRNVFPILFRRGCRLAVMGCAEEFLQEIPTSTDGIFMISASPESFFQDAAAKLTERGARRVLYFGNSSVLLTVFGKAHFQNFFGNDSSFFPFSEKKLKLRERLDLLKKIWSEGRFDGLILEINPYPGYEYSTDFYRETGIPEQTPMILLSAGRFLQQKKILAHALCGYFPVLEYGEKCAEWLISGMYGHHVVRTRYVITTASGFALRYN